MSLGQVLMVCRRSRTNQPNYSGGNMRKVLFAVAFIFSSVSWAQQAGFINLGKFDEYQTYVGSGKNASRVGNAVLFYVHQKGKEFVFSSQIMASCDVSWISDSIRTNFLFEEVNSPADMEAQARRDSVSLPLSDTELTNWQQSSLSYASALKKHIKTLCLGATAEPKNVAIPVTSYNESGKEPGGSIAILTGTVVRKGTVIDAWIRTTHFRRNPINIGGKPYEVNGVAQTTKEATGTHVMRRTAFDCLNRLMAVYQVVEYKEDGAVSKQWSNPRDKVEFDIVVPNSVGEGQLEAICRIYGGM